MSQRSMPVGGLTFSYSGPRNQSGPFRFRPRHTLRSELGVPPGLIYSPLLPSVWPPPDGLFYSSTPRREDFGLKIMPEKDPSFWAMVLNALRDNGLAMVLTFLLIWLRIQYDGKETKPVRQIIESVLGALIVMVVGLTVQKFGLSSGWSFFAAGFVGILGVDQVRQLGKRWSERKADEL